LVVLEVAVVMVVDVGSSVVVSEEVSCSVVLLDSAEEVVSTLVVEVEVEEVVVGSAEVVGSAAVEGSSVVETTGSLEVVLAAAVVEGSASAVEDSVSSSSSSPPDEPLPAEKATI
jgi:hypothetical protein